MTQQRRILGFAAIAAGLLLLPSGAAAQSATVTDDAFLSSNTNTQQFNLNGQGISLIVAGSSATVGNSNVGATKAYIKFQLNSSLPPSTAAANVVKATLKLYLSPLTKPSGTIDIYPLTSAWTESTLNSSSPPALASTALLTQISVGQANSFLVVDVTKLVQEWLNGSANGGIDNDGIALVADTSTSYVVFDSKESIVTSHEPRLEIVLANSGPQGPAGAAATIQVGTTSTLGPNGRASVTNGGTTSAAILNFAIPQGQPGAPGAQGPPGQAATIKVEPTMTVPYPTPASVMNSGAPNAADLTFLIPQGPPGAAGAQGPAGANGLGFNFRKAFDPTGVYALNDVVSYNGSSYLALAATKPGDPTPDQNPAWSLAAQQGAAGLLGPTGAQGPQRIQGIMGLPGLPGPPGPMPTGAALTTTSNNFAGSQTINGNLILNGAGSGVQFADGTLQTTAATSTSGGGATCPSFELSSTSPVVPAGYTGLGTVNAGNVWFTMAPMPTPRWELAATSMNGKVYAVGGHDSSGNMVNTLEVYDPNSNSWASSTTGAIASMPTARQDLAAAAVNGKVYAIGGGNGNVGVRNALEVFDPAGNNGMGSWSLAAGMPTAREFLAAAAVNGKVYAIGGLDGVGNALNMVEVYDPNSNSWASSTTGAIASMRTARYGLAAAAINGKIYAIGGFDGRNYLNTVEVYDPGSNSWSTAASMPTARSSLAAADASGLIYAVGGIAFKLSASSATEQYSPPVTIYTFIKN